MALTNRVLRKAQANPQHSSEKHFGRLLEAGYECVDIFMQDGYRYPIADLKKRLQGVVHTSPTNVGGAKAFWYIFQKGEHKLAYWLAEGRYLWSGMAMIPFVSTVIAGRRFTWKGTETSFLDWVSYKSNRSRTQTEFLYNLVKRSPIHLLRLEYIIRNRSIPYCPGDKDTCIRLLDEHRDLIDQRHTGWFHFETRSYDK